MGQAKQRGTFEQRKAAAIIRNEEEARVKKQEASAVYKAKNHFLQLLAALGLESCVR